MLFASMVWIDRWFRRNFYNTINVSINSFDINLAKSSSTSTPSFISSVSFNVRTVLQSEIDQIIPNSEGAKYLIQAATAQGMIHFCICVLSDNKSYYECIQ